MSMAPDPGKILDLLSLLDEDLQARSSFDSLLKRAIQRLPELLPSIVLARAYAPEANGLRLVAATDDSQAKTMEPADPFAKAMAERRVIHNAKHGLWGLPLADHQQIFGLLVLQLNEDAPDTESWLRLIAALIVQAIARQQAENADETAQLYELNRQMLGAQDALDVLRALRTLTMDSVWIIHNSYEYARQQLADAVLRHVVTPADEQVIEQSVLAQFGPAAIEHLAPLLPTWDDVILVEDTANPPANAPAMFVEVLQQQNIHSAVYIPIQQQGRVSDLILIGFPQPRQFDERARRLFRAMRDQVTIVFQVQRALQEAQQSAAALGRQVSVLQTLNDLSTVISMARDEAQLLNQSGQALVTALSIDYAQIYMLDAGQQSATIVSEYPHRGNTGRKLHPDEVPVANPPDTRNPAPIVVNNVDTDARVTEQGRLMLAADNIRSFMLLPLFVRGQVVGGIRLDIHRENRSFTPDMIEIAQTILAQVVVGLQNIRLLAESQRRSEQLQRVNQFGQTLQSTLNLSEILETALTEIHRIIPVERMTIALLDPAADELRTVGLFANGENYLTLTNGAPMQLQGSPVGKVWETRRLLHIPDIVQEQGIGADDVRELRALLVTPLLGRSEALGIISIGHSQAHIYSDTDIIVFQQMTGLLSAAIENASAFARSQRQARNEALVNEIATQLQQQVELDDMLQIAATDLGRALGARRARIRLGTRVTE